MSYYYDDTSYDYYNEPVCYTDEGTPYNPDYYDPAPSNPTYYDDTPSNPVYHADTPPYDELEAYAEVASNRIYTEDEIHPAYRDHPMSSNHEDPPTPEHHWEEYTWTRRKFDDGIIKYDPPTDPTFYIPSSHNNAPDWDLIQSIELIGFVIEDYNELFTREADDLDLIKEWTPNVDRLTRVSQHMEAILTQRRTEREVKDEAKKVCEDDDDDLQPQSISPFHHNFDNSILTTPPPDICSPNPLPLSPNIQHKDTRLTSHFLIAATKRRQPRYYFAPLPRRRHPPKLRTFNKHTRTRPPDIQPPKPHPISPNIHTRLHLHLLSNQHPPDICSPIPLPLAPNISIQPRRWRGPGWYGSHKKGMDWLVRADSIR